jgi:hypothetical protein
MQYSPFNHRLLMLPVFDPIATPAMLALTAAGGAMSAMGTLAGGKAAAQAGYASQQAHEFAARQQEQAGQEGRAVAQRSALEKRREGTLLSSKMLARAAASGGGADDPTVTKIGEDIAGRSEYDALTEMYKGENRARGLLDAAMGSRMTGDAALAEGEAKKRASYLSAAGTIIGTAGSMYGQYNKLPKTPNMGGGIWAGL